MSKRDLREALRTLEKQGEDNIWRTAKAAGDEIDRLRAALRLARGRICEDRETMGKLMKIFPGDYSEALAVQARVDEQTFAIIDSALQPSN